VYNNSHYETSSNIQQKQHQYQISYKFAAHTHHEAVHSKPITVTRNAFRSLHNNSVVNSDYWHQMQLTYQTCDEP